MGLVLSAAGGARGQEDENRWPLLPESFAEAWERLKAESPDLEVAYSGGRVSAIYGVCFGGGDSATDSAGAFVRDCCGLFGLAQDELVLTELVEPGDEEGAGPYYLRYEQFYQGEPVEGARLSVTVAPEKGHPITLVTSTLEPSPGPWLKDVTVTADEAITAAAADLSEGAFEFSDAVAVILADAGAPVRAWRVDAVSGDPTVDSVAVYVGATTGEILRKRSLTYHDNIMGTVTGKRSSDLKVSPDCSGAEIGTYNLADAKVTKVVGGQEQETAYTNEFGTYILTCNRGNSYAIWSYVESHYFAFKTNPGADPQPITMTSDTLGCPFGSNFSWIDMNYPKSEQIMNAWYWLRAGRQWIKDRRSNHPQVDTMTDVYPNIMGCASSYNGAEIFLGNGGCKCDCTGDPRTPGVDCIKDHHFATVVAHEYGHKFHSGSSSVQWNENFADAFSTFVVSSTLASPMSKLGEKLCECVGFGTDHCGGRDLDDDTIPELQWPSYVGRYSTSKHYGNGRPLSAAYWDMRDSIGDIFPAYRAGKILLHTTDESFDGVDKTLALIALQKDDNPSIFPGSGADNILTNGSPNYERINEAFRRHGLAWDNAAYKGFAVDDQSFADPAPGAGISISITVLSGGPALISSGPLKLRYRINGGAWTVATMSGSGQTGPYTYTIPGTGRVAGDWVDWYARAETVDLAKRFTCIPLQAQFVFDNDVSGYTPEERTYFTSYWTSSAKSLAFTFESPVNQEPSGWTKTNGWVWGDPIFTHYGEQPAWDYPWDAAGGSSTMCYVTGNNESEEPDTVPPDDQGARLETASFDLSSATAAVLSYALWFFVRDGSANNNKFILEIGDGNNWETIQTISTTEYEPGKWGQRVRWVRQRVLIPSNQLLSGRKLRFTALCPSGSPAEVEACVDEVKVWKFQ
jgi:hypothetical protein